MAAQRNPVTLDGLPDGEAARVRVLAFIDDLEQTDPSNEAERAAGEQWAMEVIAFTR